MLDLIRETLSPVCKIIHTPLEIRDVLQVHPELIYCPNGIQNGFTNPFAPKLSMTLKEKVFKSEAEDKEGIANGGEINKMREVIVRVYFMLLLTSAEDLAPVDLMGKADPFVVLTMKKTKSKIKIRVRFSLV
ncbi:hypothetical protein Pfo_000557 [Paulownia fortunei]|nr:hypothetical protein Pfo_000557 [Paulownia fortunei]